MRRAWLQTLSILLACGHLALGPAWALDPPHDASQSIDCGSCHITHHAPGGAITKVAGNPNLCMSCHTAGGLASEKPFADTDEAIAGTSGTSHRWDSGVSGWVKADPANTSPGAVQSGGSFTGRYAKSYTITIDTPGDAGAATFSWSTSKLISETYRDEFSAIAFDGSDGTRSWSASPWQEIVETDGTGAGVVRVVASTGCASGSCLRIGGGAIDTRGILRAADLSGATSVMLTFHYRRQLGTCPNTSVASVRIEVSGDGAAWTTRATYNLNACDNAAVSQAFDISFFLGPGLQIRLRGSGTAGGSDFIYIDDVQIEELLAAEGSTGVATGTDVSLNEGISVTFANGSAAPAFDLGDVWTVYASTDLNQPAAPALAARLASGKLTCSTCHNEHSQLAEPFDPFSPAHPPSGPGGEGRHNQRVDNETNQMCTDCHIARDVPAASEGSHPVGIAIPGGDYQPAATLPLDIVTNAVQCMSCHQLHDSPSHDGSLARIADSTALCAECHTLADTTTPASHLSPTSGVLWPGPQYGTHFPAIADASKRGACTSCHQPHGWPNGDNPAVDYPSLLVSQEESLCFACHDGSPVGNVLLQFTKSYRHPTTDYSGRHDGAEGGDAALYGTGNRHAECEDCHNPHVAAADAAAPLAPHASKRIAGVGRVAVANGAAGTVPAYTYRGPSDTTSAAEYELCFKCHSSWTAQPAGQSDMAVELNSNNRSYHPIEATGKNTNIRANSFVNGWTGTSMVYCSDCHTSEDVTVRGPHGSQYRYLLKRPFIASSGRRTTASTEACFDCHSFNTYATTQTNDTIQSYSRFNRPNFEEGHSFHVDEKRAPCYACHESHGSTTLPHLIVTGRNPGLNSYTETATGGSCSPTCHGTETYQLNYPR